MKQKLFLASINKRIFARICDILFFLFLSTVFFLLCRQFIGLDIFWQIIISNIFCVVLFFFYFILFPYFFSYQTIAKKIFGISIFFSEQKKSKSKFLFFCLRELFIVFCPLVLVWIIFLFYFLIVSVFSFNFDRVLFLGRSSFIIFVWWILYFIFIRINPQNQIFIDRWFFAFVIDNRINFFLQKKKHKNNKNFNNVLLMNKKKSNVSDNFDGFHVRLNEEQKKATSSSIEQNLRILAGPGTGKTTVLTERIIFLIKNHNILPKRILTLTFTKKACQNIKNKIIKALNFDEQINLSIFTYHAFCYFILTVEKKLLDISTPDIMILDQSDQKKVIKSLFNENKNWKQKVDPSLIKKMLMIIKYLQQDWPKDYSAFLLLVKKQDFFESMNKDNLKMVWDFWIKYNEYKSKEGFLDFNDLLIKAYQIFQSHPDVLLKWRKKYDYLAIDEFQDTNKLQFKIVEILTNAGQDLKLTVVGDPDQMIYGWRGAEMDFILNFNKYFVNMQNQTLILNYRSTQKIIYLANFLINKNKNRFPKKLITNNHVGKNNVLFYGENIFQQVNFIVKKIKQLIIDKVPLNQIVILYRVNSFSGILEKSLLKWQIPYKIFKGLEFFKRKEIKDFLTLISLLNTSKNIYTKIILSWINGMGEKTILKIEKLSDDAKQTMFDYLSENKISFLNRFQENIDAFWSVLQHLKNNLNKLQSFKIIARHLFDNIYKNVLENNVDYESRLDNINVLINEIIFDFERNHFNLSMPEKINEFLFQTHLSIDNSFSDEEKQQSLNLMTVHSAKGLEFSHVFVFNVSNNNFPKIERPTIDLEEERRLFFVAITRAQNRLYITSDRNDESIFVEEIKRSQNLDTIN